MRDFNQFYDANGNELREGDVVAAPLWQEKRIAIGTIAKLDYYAGTRDRDGAVLHRVVFPRLTPDAAGYALWKSSSMIKLSESDAVMARLRDFEVFEDGE